ncbi:hypothetical protein [Flavobacterium sp. H122]|uniref:hypothetical protein n=1 Tax=Flavobacterium sp. H122 TaxID=2529860 RepID=UPI00145ACC1E|nr:hypothetical protein [Flavobacterium sp. H122]
MMRLIISLLFFLNAYHFNGQTIKTLRLKKFKVTTLDNKLIETSGLCFLNNRLYSINDGGNRNVVYEVNTINGEISKTIPTAIPNKDWEAIITDGKYFYLGDFGNNSGTRKDLAVYQLKLENDSLKTIAEIPFEFSNQTDFSSQITKHNFDVESMIFLENKLHIFTKEWKTKGTSHYTIETAAANKQKLAPPEFFKTKFFVSDAFFYNNQLYTIGYTRKGRCFLQIFNKSENGLFFKEHSKKFRLGSVLTIGQIEGIAVNQDGIYISAEGFSKSIFKVKPTLFYIPFSALKE